MTEYIEKWPVVNRLIDLENEFQQYKPFQGFEHAMYRKVCEVEIAIGKTPDADVAPVRHGRWEEASDGDGIVCPFCRTDFCTIIYDTEYFNYCPNCGAKMDEPAEESKP